MMHVTFHAKSFRAAAHYDGRVEILLDSASGIIIGRKRARALARAIRAILAEEMPGTGFLFRHGRTMTLSRHAAALSDGRPFMVIQIGRTFQVFLNESEYLIAAAALEAAAKEAVEE